MLTITLEYCCEQSSLKITVEFKPLVDNGGYRTFRHLTAIVLQAMVFFTLIFLFPFLVT